MFYFHVPGMELPTSQKADVILCYRNMFSIWLWLNQIWIGYYFLSHAKISRGLVKNRLKITSLDKGVANNHSKALDNLVIYWCSIIETDFILG
jgi:hypothetical protein